jgi:hypothetical protein
MKKLSLKYYLWAITLVFAVHIHAQQESDGLLVFDPPSDQFIPIVLQSHKGLPRFGARDNYKIQNNTGKTPGRTVRPIRGSYDTEKSKEVGLGYRNFSLLLGLKYRTPFMGDLDRERLTTVSGNMSQEQRNSAYLQNYLRNQIAQSVGTGQVCENANRGANEFERIRNYKAFIDQCLDPLVQWSQSFFKNDEMVGYHVSTLHIGRNYDFDQKGYWLVHPLQLNDIFSLKSSGIHSVTFLPSASFETELIKKSNSKNHVDFFLQMDEGTAERLMKEGISKLYLVKKIKMVYSGKPLSRPNDRLEFNYSHVNKEMDVYLDEALTQHFTTLSMDNLILKTP